MIRRCASPTSRWPARSWAGSPRSSSTRGYAGRWRTPASKASPARAPVSAQTREPRPRAGPLATPAPTKRQNSCKAAALMAGRPSMHDAPVRSQDRPAARSPARAPLPATDIRRKRPPALSFVLRLDTLRRLSRIASLLALDFAGIFAAIFTALMVKHVLQEGDWAWQASLDETKQNVAFAYLVTALLFARSGL